jgi:hypothetical protein
MKILLIGSCRDGMWDRGRDGSARRYRPFVARSIGESAGDFEFGQDADSSGVGTGWPNPQQ